MPCIVTFVVRWLIPVEQTAYSSVSYAPGHSFDFTFYQAFSAGMALYCFWQAMYYYFIMGTSPA